LTFADAVEQITVGDSSRSRVPPDDRDRFAAERLHPKVANSRCRPAPAVAPNKDRTFNRDQLDAFGY
jgi:hypothetical protein